MSQPATEPPVQEPADNNVSQPETNQPPYFAQLESLPESVRPLVEPVFKEWDASTTKRFQELHSAQEPWKEVIESYEPSTVSEAMQLAQMLEENPKQLWDLMAQHYQFQAEQGQPTANNPAAPVEDANEEDPYNERFSKLEQTIEQLSGIIVNNQQVQTATEQQQMLDTVMADLTKKHGEFDQDYVLNRIVLGDDPDDAVAHYNTAIENAIKARGLSANGSGAPVVVSNDGGTPSVTDGGKKLSEMSNSEVENQVAAMLRQSAEASS